MSIPTSELLKYQRLFKKYANERTTKQAEYFKKHGIDFKSDWRLTSKEHPDYFKIDKQWDKRRKLLDAPLLKAAKYKIGQDLEFMKKNHWDEIFFFRDEVILSHGIVTGIKTSGDGSGEILYEFETLAPPCPEDNPYALESAVLRVIKGSSSKNKSPKLINEIIPEEFLRKLEFLTEDQAKAVLNLIYSDDHVFNRSNMRTPIAKSFKKRLIKNLGDSWEKTDTRKLERCFFDCGINIHDIGAPVSITFKENAPKKGQQKQKNAGTKTKESFITNLFNSDLLKRDLITKRRLDNNFSMDEACQQIGISKATLSRIENSKHPDVETFARICRWLKTDPKKYLSM